MDLSNSRSLFISAHADDAEINAGGLISRLTRNDQPVYVLICSWSSAIRHYEELAAMSHLGVPRENIITLTNLLDTRLHQHLNQIISAIENTINLFNIDTVFTHYPFDTHNDHKTVSEATLAAARKVDNLVFYKATYPSGRSPIPFSPNLVVKLKEEDIERKNAALREHKSQIVKYGEEEWIQRMIDTAKSDAWVHGGFHGYCELFNISRMIINDL